MRRLLHHLGLHKDFHSDLRVELVLLLVRGEP
jgi:hypothetical protein